MAGNKKRVAPLIRKKDPAVGEKERRQAAAAAVPDLFFMLDREGRFLDFHAPRPEMLLVPPKKFLGRKVSEVLPAPAAEIISAAIPRALAEGQARNILYSLPYPEGPRWYEAFLVAHGDPRRPETRLAAIVHDITERRRAEEALQRTNDLLEQRVRERTAELEQSRQDLARTEELFRQIAEGIQEVFYLLDVRTLDILYASPAFKLIWGRPQAAKFPRFEDWMASLHPDERDRIVQEFRQRLGRGECGPQEYRIVRPDGEVRWLADRAWPVRDTNGTMVRIAGLIQDITERRRLEAEILRAAETERQRIGCDLHDSLGQSLTAITYMAEALREDLARRRRPEAAEAEKLVQLIQQAAEEAHQLARGLLLADVRQGGLAAALQDLARRTRERFGLVCRYHGPVRMAPLEPEVAGQLFRIAQEAVANAAKHGRRTKIEIRLHRTSAGLQLSIRDDGSGLGRRRKKTTGLGLEIMQFRARLIGAAFWMESARGAGTTVHCQVPRRPKRRNPP